MRTEKLNLIDLMYSYRIQMWHALIMKWILIENNQTKYIPNVNLQKYHHGVKCIG